MRSNKTWLAFLFLLFTLKVIGQVFDSAMLFQQKTMQGYFVCVRDSILKTDPDHISSHYDFTIFFFPSLTDSLIQIIPSIKLSTPGYTLVSGGITSAIADGKLYRQYMNFLINNNLFSKAHNYKVFDFEKIDSKLVNSNRPFVAVFKGKLKVVGPFLPYFELFDVAAQDLFMYLPNKDNSVEYVKTILY